MWFIRSFYYVETGRLKFSSLENVADLMYFGDWAVLSMMRPVLVNLGIILS